MILGPKYKIAKRLGAPILEKTLTQKFALSEARSARAKTRHRQLPAWCAFVSPGSAKNRIASKQNFSITLTGVMDFPQAPFANPHGLGVSEE